MTSSKKKSPEGLDFQIKDEDLERNANQKFEKLSEKAFQQKKEEILASVVPMSFIAMPTATVMLILGSKHTKEADGEKSCDFDLPLLLMLTGTISLGLVVMGVVARYIVQWIVENGMITLAEQYLITALHFLVRLMIFLEFVLLVALTAEMMQFFKGWQYKDKTESNYCEYGLVVFTSSLLFLTWIFVFFAGGVYIYVNRKNIRNVLLYCKWW